MKPESLFYRSIRSYLPGDISRIENLVESGMPDISGAHMIDYWVELKMCRSKTIDLAKLLRPQQKVWHNRRILSGSLIFIVVRHIYLQHNTILIYRGIKASNRVNYKIEAVVPKGSFASITSILRRCIEGHIVNNLY